MKTAVEWIEELIECGANLEQIKKCLPRAKAMEKEQIMKARQDGFNRCFRKGDRKEVTNEQYYNETSE